jgi:hypothetical protein
MKYLILIIILSIFLPEISVSTTFYVDQNHTAASDDNNGSENSPWLTLQHAADTVVPGDTVIVKPGNYGRLVIRNGGSAGEYITFRAELPPDRSHIDKVTMLDPENPVNQGGNPAVNALVAGILIAPVWNSVTPVTHVRIENFEITHIDPAQRSGIYIQFSEDIEVRGNFLHNLNPTRYNDNGISGGGSVLNKRVLVEDNILFRVMGVGIVLTGEDWIVQNNKIFRGTDVRSDLHPSDEGFWKSGDTDATRFFGTGHSIRYNHIYDYFLEESYGSPHIDAFQTFSVHSETQYASHILIEYNFVQNMGGQIFISSDTEEMNGGWDAVNNITLRNNVLIGSGAVGVMIGRYSNHFTIENNIIARCGYGGLSISGNSDHVTVRNNIFYLNYERDPDNRRGQMLTDTTCFKGSIWDYNLHHPDFTWPHKPKEGSLFAQYDMFGVDPLFVDPDNPLGPDGIPFTEDDGYRLAPGSLAIGAGHNGVDLGPYPYVLTDRPTGVSPNGSNPTVPNAFALYQNYPNPFNPVTTITYQLPETGAASLKIYDLLGREIVTLVNEDMPAGTHTVQWNGRNSAGNGAASGIYFYQVQSSGGYTETKKMMLIR